MPKETATLFVFDSSSGCNQYQTLQYTDGTTSCDCPGWTRRNPPSGRSCKHTRFVDAGLGNRNAVKVVEYSAPAPVRRTPQRAMPEPVFRPTGRKFQLTD